jgi:hypothetical protein
LLAPITNGERPGINKRSPLVRTKGGLAPPVFVEQVNRYLKKNTRYDKGILKIVDKLVPVIK